MLSRLALEARTVESVMCSYNDDCDRPPLLAVCRAPGVWRLDCCGIAVRRPEPPISDAAPSERDDDRHDGATFVDCDHDGGATADSSAVDGDDENRVRGSGESRE